MRSRRHRASGDPGGRPSVAACARCSALPATPTVMTNTSRPPGPHVCGQRIRPFTDSNPQQLKMWWPMTRMIRYPWPGLRSIPFNYLFLPNHACTERGHRQSNVANRSLHCGGTVAIISFKSCQAEHSALDIDVATFLFTHFLVLLLYFVWICVYLF